jgi:hypothetical protein
MQALFNAFWQIVLFRQGPDSLPASRPLLVMAVAAYIVIDVMVIVALYPREALVPLLLADVGFMVVWCAGLLALFSKIARLDQTLTALFGCGALLQLLAFPTTAWPSFGIPLEIPMGFRVLVSLIILLWSVAVFGHIFARALSKSLGAGIAFAVIYYIVIYEVAARWSQNN